MLKGNPAYKKLAGVQGKAKKKKPGPAPCPGPAWPVACGTIVFEIHD